MKAASPSFTQSQRDRLLETVSLSDTVLTSQLPETSTSLLQNWVLVIHGIQKQKIKKNHIMNMEEK